MGKPVDLVGASWGALVAATCAALHPGSVRRLLLGGFQARTHPRLQAVARRCIELIEGGSARGQMADFFITEFGTGLPNVIQNAMRKQFANLTDAQLRQMHTQTSTVAVGGDLRDLVDLRRIAADVFVINGADDPLVDATDYEGTAGCFRYAELHVIAGLGHFLHLERPSLIELYLDFVQRPSDLVKIA